jgi:hypothetical protein
MARTPVHQAKVTLVRNPDYNDTSMPYIFRVVKVLRGVEDYAIMTPYGYNCYMAAMDMARDEGSRVFITPMAAAHMNYCATSVDGEWTVQE